jgi:hypothetical protein
MNYLELVNEVLQELDAQPVATLVGATGLVRRAMTWVNRTMVDIASRSNDWSFREAETTLNMTPNVAMVALPNTVDADTIKTVADAATGVPLASVDYEFWETLSLASGPPLVYSLFSQQLLLYPTPTQAGSLVLRYQLNPVKLVNNTDLPLIPEKWHHVIVSGAVFYGKLFLSDPDYKDQFILYEQQIKSMLSHNRDGLGRHPGMMPEA